MLVHKVWTCENALHAQHKQSIRHAAPDMLEVHAMVCLLDTNAGQKITKAHVGMILFDVTKAYPACLSLDGGKLTLLQDLRSHLAEQSSR